MKLSRLWTGLFALVMTLGLGVGTAMAQVNIAPLGSVTTHGNWGTWGDPAVRGNLNDGVYSWSSTDGYHSDGSLPVRICLTWTTHYRVDRVDLVHTECCFEGDTHR